MIRNITNKINTLLELFPVVVLLGARQSGKTTLSRTLRPDWLYLDLERGSDLNRLDYDPEFFFQENPHHVIIDEAQRLPRLFEILRSVIDSDRQAKGRFLITGSSSLELLKNVSESLAGRVAIVELGTCKANEIAQKPLSPIYDLLAHKNFTREALSSLENPLLTLADVQYAWQKGGYPEPVFSHSDTFYWQWMENYENTYIHRDIAALFPRLNRTAYQRFLTMLCRLSSTILNKADIARALEVSASTVHEFLSIAEGTFLWRRLPSYEKSVSQSIVKMPKGYIRDSGLLHALLKMTDKEKLYNDPIVGASFEAFVIEEIIKGLQSTLLTHWSSYYYRTRGGAEIDCILEGPFGTLPIEIKYGVSVKSRQLESLENYVKNNHLDFGLIINQAEKAVWLSQYVFQLPVTYL